MVALWYGLILLPLIAIPVLWWNYRRKQEARERQVNMRWGEMVAGSKASPQAPALPVAQAPFCRRERVLDAEQTLVYFLLKSGLPDCEILVRTGLHSLLTLPDESAVADRELRLRGLGRHTLDFAVCDKRLRPVAAVDLAGPALPAEAQTFRSAALAQAGIRYVCLARTDLPKRDAVRARVLGE